ncbi:SDR family NAD(P)-dependent oxidoreductase [Herbidospora mongoliensis]|uniref:SDR family NAD(P)-dependent oxidoreductase n=1 Tax=Herbidospora mongoliensis TaxID=688067 RepID=UPI00082EBA0B|nr:glucose 1-dehydrogenase [Herbidospora mongoliensis]
MGALEAKAALVTGGSRGIGRAVVQKLAREGAHVVFSFNENRSAAEEVVAHVARFGGVAHAVRADMGCPDDVKLLFEQVVRQLGTLDILVNNAAINPIRRIIDATAEDFDRVMGVNARGPFLAIQAASRILRAGGRIVNISSFGTRAPAEGLSLYLASKAALELLTAVAARELGARGITVNAVSPGVTDTELMRESTGVSADETFDGITAKTALRRLGEPADIANVVAFLAGPDSQWITGQNLRATGGLIV